MSRPARLAALWLSLFVAGPLAAAEIAVAPGTGTLAAAIAGAADGDTLILGDGGYFGAVVVDKSLTIRPVNRSTDAVIDGTVTIEGAGITVTLQGLKLNQSVVLNQAAAIRLLENAWLASGITATSYKTSEGDGSLVIVGNVLSSGSIASVYSDGAYIAGNTLLSGSIVNYASAWIVGNTIASTNRGIGSIGGGSVRILGNRVKCSYFSTTECLYSTAQVSLVAGNVVEVNDTQATSYNTQYGIAIPGGAFTTVVNNVVRATPANTFRYGSPIAVAASGHTITHNSPRCCARPRAQAQNRGCVAGQSRAFSGQGSRRVFG
jgi:nitrous oxidase accessory protein NosD